MTDARSLVDRIVAGNKKAFQTFIHEYQALVSHIVFRMIPNEADREDICQDVFMKVYQNLAVFQFDAKLSTWIAKIAYNRCLDFLEKKRALLYDDNGNLTFINYPKLTRRLYYYYNMADRVDSIKGYFLGDDKIYVSDVKYAPFGGFTSFTYDNGITTHTRHNLRYQIDSLYTSGASIINRSYDFDSLGNIIQINDHLHSSKSETLFYDALSRLTQAISDNFPGDTIRYTYSGNGNRLTKIIGTDTTFYHYSSNKLDSTTKSESAVYRNDNNGNVIFDSSSTYEDSLQYDAMNRLISINAGDKGSYYYDGEGKRIMKVYGSTTTLYLYDQFGNLIAETDEKGDWIADYVYLDGMLVVKSTEKSQVSGGGRGSRGVRPPPHEPLPEEFLSYYHLDHLGTPLFMTDSAKTVVWSAEYLPFGEVDSEYVVVENEFRFPGQYHDQETDLYYNWYRYYKPVLGRYYQPDPLELSTVNRYQYAENNPIKNIDPTGESTAQRLNIASFQIVCAISHFTKWREKLRNVEEPYYLKDKLVHCMASCEISVNCFNKSDTETYIMGIGFEIYGLYKKIRYEIRHHKPPPGSGFSFEDIAANKVGLTCAKSKCSCEECCHSHY